MTRLTDWVWRIRTGNLQGGSRRLRGGMPEGLPCATRLGDSLGRPTEAQCPDQRPAPASSITGMAWRKARARATAFLEAVPPVASMGIVLPEASVGIAAPAASVAVVIAASAVEAATVASAALAAVSVVAVSTASAVAAIAWAEAGATASVVAAIASAEAAMEVAAAGDNRGS